jgi:uncharacterized YigZ family protein
MSTTPSAFWIPATTLCIEQEIKKSRFIATLGAASCKEEVLAFIEKRQKEHSNARHHTWAYLLGNPSNTTLLGMSDDGEPKGTAGKPMLQMLEYKQIGDVVLVITRYFGGIKLGAGGLVRAYASTAQLALEQVPLQKKVSLETLWIHCPYELESALRHFLQNFPSKILNVQYHEAVTLHLEIPEEEKCRLQEELKTYSQGKVKILHEI